MDETSQNILIENRKIFRITGVSKITSLNPLEFILETSLGILTIKGADMEMKSFDIDKKIIDANGKIDSFFYNNKSSKKTDKGFIQKLFK